MGPGLLAFDIGQDRPHLFSCKFYNSISAQTHTEQPDRDSVMRQFASILRIFGRGVLGGPTTINKHFEVVNTVLYPPTINILLTLDSRAIQMRFIVNLLSVPRAHIKCLVGDTPVRVCGFRVMIKAVLGQQ